MASCEKNIFRYIRLLKKFRVRCFCLYPILPFISIITVNSYINPSIFKRFLQRRYINFKYECNYRLTYESERTRLVIIKNVYSDLMFIRDKITRKYNKKHPVINPDCKIFHPDQCKTKKPQIRLRQLKNQKRHSLFYKIQTHFIDKSIALVKINAQNNGICVITLHL